MEKPDVAPEAVQAARLLVSFCAFGQLLREIAAEIERQRRAVIQEIESDCFRRLTRHSTN